ncbi:MAG: hypothetical protein ACI841_003895, partial [Planctomycetota bacterium]
KRWEETDEYLNSLFREKKKKKKKKKSMSISSQSAMDEYGLIVAQVTALGYLPDKGSAKTLLAILEDESTRIPGLISRRAAISAAQIGSLKCIEASIALMERIEIGKPSSVFYRNRVSGSLTGQGTFLLRFLEKFERSIPEDAVEISRQLTVTAELNGIAPPVSNGLDVTTTAKRWAEWLDTVRESWPSTLPAIDGPVLCDLAVLNGIELLFGVDEQKDEQTKEE